MSGRRLQLNAVHHLVPLGEGTWRMTGSDPQFLVPGPFASGVWEWQLRAGVQADTPAPGARIYYAPDGQFTDAASVRFSLPRDPDARTLRFWLPCDATLLRFDPSDAPGTLVLGDVTARRRGRLDAAARAFLRQAHRRGLGGVAAWVRDLAVAAKGGGSALRARMVDLITAEESVSSAEWVAAIVERRAARYHPRPERGLLSLISTVYDTPPAYLHELAGSLRAQTWSDYEWVLLDNGSRDTGTRAALAAIAQDRRVTLLRAEHNLGILGGMRLVLERASGRYVLPVDSDDYLFPDALTIFAAVLQGANYPPLAYSDEDKLRDGRHVDPFEKPGWDPVLFRNCCYIAHLCAIDREQALRLGVYSDAAAEGCHDWDTFFRFARAGLAPVHVPEILYSWRMHSASTAANVDAKDYVIDSQRHVLERHLEETGLAARFRVVRSPLFPVSPDWWIRRERSAPLPIALVLHGDGASAPEYSPSTVVRADPDEPPLRAWQRAATTAPHVVAFDTRLILASDEAIWEMAGLRESFPDAAIVGGRLLDASRLIADTGRSADDPGYFGTALKQRTVERVDLRLALLDAKWLGSLDPAPYDAMTLDELSSALAAAARRSGRRVIASPFIEATL